MGWRYRKSLNLGPLRVNISKSGVGYSVGGPGFRTGVRASGRRYSTVTLPGTGISYTTLHGRLTSQKKSAAGWFTLIAILVLLLIVYLIRTYQ